MSGVGLRFRGLAADVQVKMYQLKATCELRVLDWRLGVYGLAV